MRARSKGAPHIHDTTTAHGLRDHVAYIRRAGRCVRPQELVLSNEASADVQAINAELQLSLFSVLNTWLVPCGLIMSVVSSCLV